MGPYQGGQAVSRIGCPFSSPRIQVVNLRNMSKFCSPTLMLLSCLLGQEQPPYQSPPLFQASRSQTKIWGSEGLKPLLLLFENCTDLTRLCVGDCHMLCRPFNTACSLGLASTPSLRDSLIIDNVKEQPGEKQFR